MSAAIPYSEIYPVLRHDCDLYRRMKPSAMLRYTQQIATIHAEKLGLDEAYYEKNHVAFLLAKQALQFTRIPTEDEVLTYTTYPEGCKRATYKRVTVITDAQGCEVACLDSRWVLVDTQTRRIVRRAPADMQVQWLENVERTLDLTIPKAAELQSAGLRRADYSLCDRNGHMNNTCYVD
ncbi:MAG: acyl-ACP thioesterase, partial [Oscillospiraceae bacterium]|nr:acyl-ACP thioesterase [Oscillospiraceae bacterium]